MVTTNILEVLTDGTITRLELKTEPVSVTISRAESDQKFIIEKVDVVDYDHLEAALKAIADHLHDYCIYSIDVNCVDGSTMTLTF